MARSFFDQVLITESPKPGSKWMKAASLVVHVAIVLVVVILPITAAFDLPGVYTSLPPVVIAQVAKIPPPPAMPSAPSVAPAAVQTVPLEAPQGITKEVEQPPSIPSPLGVPGGINTGSLLQTTGYIKDGTLSVPPPPEQPAPRRVGGDVKPPERKSYKAPQYPPVAQAARIEGTVILEAIIDAEGVVQNVKVLRSVPLLDRAAIEAVQQWRYTPTRLNGVAIPIIMSVTVTFSLKEPVIGPLVHWSIDPWTWTT